MAEPGQGDEAAPADLVAAFGDRVIAIATMHGKQDLIAPLLADAGLRCTTTTGFDTDSFGTFTRDVARVGDQLTTARRKAVDGARHAGLTIGVASEGSFGPHPSVPWLPANLELVVLVDLQTGLEVVGRSVTTEVVMGHHTVASVDEALAWAAGVGFPEHGVGVRPGPDTPTGPAGITKGIRDDATLRRAVAALVDGPTRSAFLEVDLRAHMNPTRQVNIRRAALDLMANLRRACPRCRRPGFALDRVEPGLPCQWCATPTDAALASVYRCTGCGHEHRDPGPDATVGADPALCPACNP